MSKLTEIEQEISGCVKVDKSNWTRIYRLMEEVDREKLYLERPDTPSFTSWVNALADTLKVHVSLLWTRKKAGKVYDEYYRRATASGRQVPNLDALSASPDSIVLCEKVAGKNAAEMDHLIEKVLEGDLTRADLRAAAKARLDKPKTRHDRIEAEARTETDIKVTASDIILALRHSEWLQKGRENAFFSQVYRVFPEFRLHTGTAHHARRVDAMVAETITATETDEITLHGIEIKVDLHDLEGDTKMAEYTDFCDYFYIAIPSDDADMLMAAKQLIRPTWGILLVSKDGSISVNKEPQRLAPIFKDKALATCLIKMMSISGIEV